MTEVTISQGQAYQFNDTLGTPSVFGTFDAAGVFTPGTPAGTPVQIDTTGNTNILQLPNGIHVDPELSASGLDISGVVPDPALPPAAPVPLVSPDAAADAAPPAPAADAAPSEHPTEEGQFKLQDDHSLWVSEEKPGNSKEYQWRKASIDEIGEYVNVEGSDGMTSLARHAEIVKIAKANGIDLRAPEVKESIGLAMKDAELRLKDEDIKDRQISRDLSIVKSAGDLLTKASSVAESIANSVLKSRMADLLEEKENHKYELAQAMRKDNRETQREWIKLTKDTQRIQANTAIRTAQIQADIVKNRDRISGLSDAFFGRSSRGYGRTVR